MILTSKENIILDLKAYGETELAKKVESISTKAIDEIGKMAAKHIGSGGYISKHLVLGAIEFFEGALREPKRNKRDLSVYNELKDNEHKINYEIKIRVLKYLPFIFGIISIILADLVLIVTIGSRYGILQIIVSFIAIGIIRYAFLEKILISVIDEEKVIFTGIKNALFYGSENREIQIFDLKKVDFQLNGWQMPYSLEFHFKTGNDLIYKIPILTLTSKIEKGAKVIDSYVYAKNNKLE